jgi:phage repressor protein C with HTH and peptisase S24 domain
VVQDVDWEVVRRGGIFVLTKDHHLLLKRLQVLMDGSLRIISDNPAYDAETIAAGELEHQGIIIHGQVFFVGGKPRAFG